MPALLLDLVVEQGSTWAHGWLPKINDEPVLDTGWTARAQIRATIPAEAVLHEWSTEDGNAEIDTDVGSVTLALAPADSSAWDWRSAYYDVEITSPDGEITYRISQGKIKVTPEVTR